MSKEELYKALKIFNREDLIYENNEIFNNFEEYMNDMKQEKAIEVFMSTEDMIKYSKLEEEIEKLNNIINEFEKFLFRELQIYGGGGTAQEYYDKLQELKGSDKE